MRNCLEGAVLDEVSQRWVVRCPWRSLACRGPDRILHLGSCGDKWRTEKTEKKMRDHGCESCYCHSRAPVVSATALSPSLPPSFADVGM